jgi:hypothetical protein
VNNQEKKALNAIKGSAGPAQEGFLRNRGWVRLQHPAIHDRADVWTNLRASGDEVGAVYPFRFALRRAIETEMYRKRAAVRRSASVHHNEAWLDLQQAEPA